MIDPSELPGILQGLSPRCNYDGFGWRRVEAYEFTQKGQQVFYDEGPLTKGARFSPVGHARALYYAESQKTAIRESKPSGISLSSRQPRSDYDMQVIVRLNAVLDLGEASVRRRLKTTLDELKEPWIGAHSREDHWPPTWHLGKATFLSERFDAIRYPSAKHDRHYCIAIFTGRLVCGAHLEAIHPQRGAVRIKVSGRLRG